MTASGDVTADAVAWARLRRSGLIDPFRSAVECARTLVGVQSQFVPPAGLAIHNRLAGGFTETELDDLLHREKRLLRLWGQRNTVHVYDTADWGAVVSACEVLPTYRQRIFERLGRSDADMERALDRMAEILRSVERASRQDLIDADPRLADWLQWGNVPIIDLVRRGVACHAGVEGNSSYFAHREVWLPGSPDDRPAHEEAVVGLARRYFATYGPATERDFAFWLGARITDARRWLASVSEELVSRALDGTDLLDRPEAGGMASRPPPRDEWPVRLLHRFDPLLLAHEDKSWLVDEEHYKAVWRKAGYVEAVVLQRGRIAGTWAYERKRDRVTIRLRPFRRPNRGTVAVLEREAHRQAGYFRPESVEVVIE